ncbi:MAG TPA: hypothetical protein VK698_32305 [Kofleriaceae bacterium]|nr:hypothetical protein [Kofleriaceae bacterium]
MLSALLKGCLFVSVCWSVACVPPNGGWQSQPGSQEQEQPAGSYDGAGSYDETDDSDEGSASGYGGDGDSGDDGGGGGDGSGGGGGGGGSSWSCKATATFANDGPINAMGAGNSRDEAVNDAFNNCVAIFNTTMSTDQITERNRVVESDCAVTECNHWQ